MQWVDVLAPNGLEQGLGQPKLDLVDAVFYSGPICDLNGD
jgi:hypothetical protein